MDLYTKNGRPLQVLGDTVYSGSGTIIGRIKGEKVLRHRQSIRRNHYGWSARVPLNRQRDNRFAFRGGKPRRDRKGESRGSAIWSDEPDIPD